MWIVRLALRRPYTFIVMALFLVLGGVYVTRKTPTDILPEVDIPVISVVWTYGGLPAQQMEQQITQFSEYSLSGNVSDIKTLQSESFDGVSVIRLFLHPGADVPAAMAQVTAASQTILRRMPPNTIPPIILRYTASSVPILQLAFSSDTLSESEIFDHVNQRVRTMLSVVQGTRFPLPSGGKTRQIAVDLDLAALRAHGLSPSDVNLAISAQNLTLPTGAAKIGEREYRVSLNSSPEAIAALNEIPIRASSGRPVYVKDVAHVHDGYAVQTNIARRDGKRSVVLSVMKTGGASTTEVASRVKAMVPTIEASAPKGLDVELLSDQSTFVTRAIDGLVVEGVIAALLTATMILLFLGSFRSTIIVAISIPLSVIVALLCMRALGQTINVMTLGGLALAVGILVDDATVEIENIHRNLAMGKPLTRAILDGAQQIAVPAFVASLCISIVFVSVVFLEGPAKFIFLPMGMAVAFSVMASYLLSRTLVPTLVKYLLAAEVEAHAEHAARPRGFFGRIHDGFNARFERLRARYVGLLGWALGHRKTMFAAFGVAALAAAALAPFVGRDFFPSVDAGQVRLHVTAPPGTRIEETERWFSRVEGKIREIVPEEDRVSILDFIGMPGGYNLSITDSSNVSSADGEILVTLAHARSRSTQDTVRALRAELPRAFPELSFYFQPADMVTQILNFGLPSPIDVQVSGVKRDATLAIAKALEADLRKVPGAVDVHLHQVVSAPRLHIDVDRLRATEAGLTERDVAANLLLTVSSSSQVNPTFWTDATTGNSYPVALQVPEYRVDSIDTLSTLSLPTPLVPGGQKLLVDLADIERRTTPVFVSHTNIQPTYNVRADVQDADLGSVTSSLDALVTKYREKLPPGATISVRGQADSMRAGFASLGVGLAFAALLVYALMVINFQSWKLPFIILMALPGAAVGIVFMLFATRTTFSIPSLMGAVMSIGVATANSILVVTFANEQRASGMSATDAALEAGSVRLRPVMMTALAMLIGMLPMSLGLGEGGEQNAALGRAVIGGLIGATAATLGFVPVVYSALAATWRPAERDPHLEDPTESGPPNGVPAQAEAA
ncbi:MAG: efflux RND transporter permease subunit [Labilithrix sp.]|nr:efflux RND transporter permease subunit [Labilithrix sp.]